MISPFNLPSNPEKEIHLREATVGDAMDFSDVDAAREEAATTLFLNTIQDKATFYDSKYWTGEDRRFALVWYYMHTEKDTTLSVSYDCGACSKEHSFSFDVKDIAAEYSDIRGKSERDIEFEGQKVIVRPLNGISLEMLEIERIALADAKARAGEQSGGYRKQAARIKLKSLLWCCEFPGMTGDEKERLVFTFGVKKLERFLDAVGEQLVDMRHGLLTEYENGKIFLVSPTHACPEKEVLTRVRVPFRPGDYIPEL
jgi:hypothetical protein